MRAAAPVLQLQSLSSVVVLWVDRQRRRACSNTTLEEQHGAEQLGHSCWSENEQAGCDELAGVLMSDSQEAALQNLQSGSSLLNLQSGSSLSPEPPVWFLSAKPPDWFLPSEPPVFPNSSRLTKQAASHVTPLLPAPHPPVDLWVTVVYVFPSWFI